MQSLSLSKWTHKVLLDPPVHPALGKPMEISLEKLMIFFREDLCTEYSLDVESVFRPGSFIVYESE